MAALLATGGSTNHLIHWVAVARSAGIKIDWNDFAELSSVVPLLARVYPNGRPTSTSSRPRAARAT
jgi:phosphogluconate dehydratase